ncbi:coatomer subunit gamma [Crepidotus variabilis]|uniref:Coatomer subunit gamma n=1 Tax=Crepidotus variabilis TaxID=179855 RepID=A0A9P6EN06_9AGAR|nr:coatomer subunit gamma [Crepidotus variabilis]
MASFAMTFYSKKEDESGLSSYYNNKTTIVQEARVFNDSPISPRKCRALLTRIVYLLYVGETFSTQEATNLFFGTTKLFQHKDSALRQAVYLAIKELSTTAEDVIMVTSSIMKDMQSNSEVIYRPNAIRALCKIIDPSMAQGVERFFKAAIVDRTPSISSAALVSSYHLFPNAKDVVKRWVNEAQEAVNAKPSSSLFGSSSSGGGGYLGFGGGSSQPSGAQTMPSTSHITQYHALGLLYLIRQQDRMAVIKMIQQLGGGKSGAGTTLKNPMALCMLIRYSAKVMEEDPNVQRQFMELLDGWLRHKSDMVNFEAARAICEMKNVTATQLNKPISVLQTFLGTPKPVLKFAATRTLATLALTHPTSVATCNMDLETLIADPNRSVATYAITTLLKTGNEASVDRLIKQITGFLSEISDEFKVIIVEAVRSLCLKFPTKHASMLTFLSGVLRDEGGYEFKRAVVEAMFDMIKFIPEAKEQALSHLCEFIEDCEFTKLSVRILHLLGVEGPKSPQPAKYIRFIYNRVVLENATVRAAAVTSLAKFGVNSAEPTLKKSITVLLNRCLDDVDDEVRDRAALYLKVFKEKPLADTYVKEESVFSLAALEAQLVAYVKDPAAAEKPFDSSAVPKISRTQAAQEVARPTTLDTLGPVSKKKTDAPLAPSAAEKQSAYAQELLDVPEFSAYGPVLNSSANPSQLTESETEYQVNCVKHIFKEHVVFQFNISNTLPDTVLEQVSVIMVPQSEEAGLVEDFCIPLPSLSAVSSPGIVYVSFTREDPDAYTIASFQCTLKYISKELDPSTGAPEEEGYEDEYQIEEVELSAGGDYIVPSYASFGAEWDRMRSAPSATETFALTAMESLKAACDSIIEVLNMEALGGSESPTSTSVHTLQLSGLVTGGGGKVLVRSRMTFSRGEGVTLELGVRADKQEVCDLVLAAVGG